MLVLPSELDAQVDETWGLNQLNEAAQRDELGRVHLDLSEPGDESVGKLVVAREQAQGQCADWIG